MVFVTQHTSLSANAVRYSVDNRCLIFTVTFRILFKIVTTHFLQCLHLHIASQQHLVLSLWPVYQPLIPRPVRGQCTSASNSLTYDVISWCICGPKVKFLEIFLTFLTALFCVQRTELFHLYFIVTGGKCVPLLCENVRHKPAETLLSGRSLRDRSCDCIKNYSF